MAIGLYLKLSLGLGYWNCIWELSLVGVDMSLFSTNWLDVYGCSSVPPAELETCLPGYPMEEGLHQFLYDGLISTTQLNLGRMDASRVSLQTL